MAGSREAPLAELLAPPDTRRHRHRHLTADLLLAGACMAGYGLAASGRLWPAWALTAAAGAMCLRYSARHRRPLLAYRPSTFPAAWLLLGISLPVIGLLAPPHLARATRWCFVVGLGVMAFACYCVSVRALLRTAELARLHQRSVEDAGSPGSPSLQYWLTAVAPALLALLLVGVSQALANPQVAWSP